MKFIIQYFFRGLLLTAPVVVTIYLVWVCIRWIDNLLPFDIPGLGILIIFGFIVFIGYLGTLFFILPFFSFLERLMEKAPLVKIIYTSVKDLLGAFVSDKKKFNKPVRVVINRENGIERIGFVTQENLSGIGIEGKVAVYFPHSYTFAGYLFIVPSENVTPMNISGTQAMKFIASGGVTQLH